jgi:hypothetical protein
MRTFLLFILLLPLLAGCGQRGASGGGIDSTVKVPATSAEQARFIAEHQNTVFTGLDFGASKEAYDRYAEQTFRHGVFVNLDYYDFAVTPLFSGDRLYSLSIQTPKLRAAVFYDELYEAWQKLVSQMEDRHREYAPFRKLEDPFPSAQLLKPGIITYTHRWLIGRKRIDIGVGCFSDDEFFAGLYFSDLELEKQSRLDSLGR